MELTSEHTPISAAEFTHNRLVHSAAWGGAAVVARNVRALNPCCCKVLCNACILYMSRSYRLLAVNALQSPIPLSYLFW